MDIGPPPEFGTGGSSPPVTSAPVEITRWNLNKSVSEFLSQLQDVTPTGQPADIPLGVLAVAIGRTVWATWRGREAKPLEIRGQQEPLEIWAKRWLEEKDVRNADWNDVKGWQLYAIYDRFWQRNDPVTQLPPGGSDEVKVSLRIGISKEHADEVARSLGITGGAAHHLGISAQLSEKSTTRVALSLEREESHNVTLTNPLNETYRRLAIWHVVHRLTIAASPTPSFHKRIVIQETEFVLSDVTNVTSVDVGRPGHK